LNFELNFWDIIVPVFTHKSNIIVFCQIAHIDNII